MKRRFKRTIRINIIGATCVAILATTGCASIANDTQSIGNAVGVKDRTTASAIGGGIVGCIGGAIGGAFKGGLVGVGIGCGIGGAAMATVAAVSSVKVQLDEQRKAQAALQAELSKTNAGLQVVLQTKTITDTGPTSKEVDAWDKTTVPLPENLVRVHSPEIAAVISKAGVLAAQSKGPTPVQIDVYSQEREHAWITSLLDTAIPNGSQVRYRWHQSVKPSLVLSPIPTPATK
ncbi:hypothetical protein OVY01_22470 [Robbsia sp. Bb-Pol-6]|uniref:Glycine zipper domain-containing protein n=1 Tax=Robbsia betulipollinis TaxID=2981849 RepID=A0ABT3ZTU6_9BURK|nr:hypothetical protein [Robbsia betulipollinis]MCY0389907.1 hypothetical protein [Robbsia betulipollinis]